MSKASKHRMEQLLQAHYRAERITPDAASKAATLAAVRAVAASEQSACEKTRKTTFARFIATQVRFIHPRVWMAQLVLLVIMVVLCLQLGSASYGLSFVSSILAAATVLVGLPDLLSSATHRVAELEYACRFDCRAVILARLIILGCSDVVVVTVLTFTAPLVLGADPFASLVHVCAPYFLSCAGALFVVRRCTSSQVLPLACLWILLVIIGANVMFSLAPGMYSQASIGVWALVAAASFVWTAHEVHTWLRCIAGGLDLFVSASTPR